MKKSNAELMKELDLIKEQINDLLLMERDSITVSYVLGEEYEMIPYDVNNTTEKLFSLYERQRHIKQAINLANATTIVPEFSMSIFECLIYLAQLSNIITRLERLAAMPKKARTSNYGKSEYKLLCFDSAAVKEEYYRLKEIKNKLQIAIDKANLNNSVEV